MYNKFFAYFTTGSDFLEVPSGRYKIYNEIEHFYFITSLMKVNKELFVSMNLTELTICLCCSYYALLCNRNSVLCREYN